MAKLYTAQHVAKARLGPLHLMLLVAVGCLAGGYLIGMTSSLPWKKTSKRGRRAVPAGNASLVWQGEGYAPSRHKCEDSCAGFTRNGVCNEGRATVQNAWSRQRVEQDPANAALEVLCDLGTDCGDCGPWLHTATDAALKWRPIKEIRAASSNFSVFVRQTVTPRPFFIAYTDPQKDVDVSAYIHNHALFEHGFTWIWHNLLKGECIDQEDQRRLVVDVGANFGYYSLLAASMGCRVVAWEPVPHFAAYFKYALLRNNMTRAVELRDGIVSNSSGTPRTILAPQRGIWGTAGIDGKNLDQAIDNEGAYVNVTKATERVDEVVKEDVLIMKVDVEGFEPSILRGTRGLLLQHEVKHIFMEYSPGVAGNLVRANYTILHLEYEFRDKWPEWEGKKELPAMEEVTQAGLVADIEDAWRLQEHTLGCPMPQELQGSKPPIFSCGALPEGLDPHSFRSTFGHNTNLWAFKRQPWFAKIGSAAALVPPTYDVRHKFFVKGGEKGAARRPCLQLQPDVQVAHRCPCTDKDVCGELEQRVKELAKEGKMPPFPLEGRAVEPDKMGIETWQ
ncbi:hypothetical protein CHLNCDRAFT_133271 [Chlorella variabilis]|uniref:Methyltransferase FkbM domain-containing protein n=1 Tax=Chlorella variabilis TaxID=554065 RepID=E1Z2R6_CHLVA|nr:hypothetical protein CHLNCDRAFT_133271 [Chlorella variabilis]EFN60043.1 hypothetical protein CHLNCDRAFT_133271 [Chlorella variabilis]|eukprot:XP_005852145.1 hypothetical protein CHLNCDRAFT_133271 [Chlorella variabilis]